MRAAPSQMPVTMATPTQGTVSAACWIGPERRLNAMISEAADEEHVARSEEQFPF